MLPDIRRSQDLYRHKKKRKKSNNRYNYRSQGALKLQNNGYNNNYSPEIFNGESYTTRPFKYQQTKKQSEAASNHQKAIIPLMFQIEDFLQQMEKRVFKKPKMKKKVKKKILPFIPNQPKIYPKTPPHSPFVKERPQKLVIQKEPIVFGDTQPTDIKKPQTPKQGVDKERIKFLWKWLRIHIKGRYFTFAWWWIQREYQKIVRVRELSLKFQIEHYKSVESQLINMAYKLAPNGFNSAWYDTTSYLIIFEEELLDNYFLQQEATNEDTFMRYTKDRVQNVHVKIFFCFILRRRR